MLPFEPIRETALVDQTAGESTFSAADEPAAGNATLVEFSYLSGAFNPNNNPVNNVVFTESISTITPFGAAVNVVSVTAPGANCTVSARQYTCRLATIGPRVDWIITVKVRHAPEVKRFLSNITVTASQTAPGGWVRTQVLEMRPGELRFEESDYPNLDSWRQPPGTGTVEGNQIRITLPIENLRSAAPYRDVGTSYLPGKLWLHFRDAEDDSPLEVYEIDKPSPLPSGRLEVNLEPQEQKEIRVIWDTNNRAWDGDDARFDQEVKVLLTYDQAGQQIINEDVTREIRIVPRPVVLVHGLGGSAAVWSEDGGNIPALLDGRYPGWYAVGATGMDLGTSPYGSHDTGKSTAWNADRLDEFIETVRENRNAWQIDLVGHSFGGLVIRRYVHFNMSDQLIDGRIPPVRRAITLGTPHLGSGWCDALDALNLGLDIGTAYFCTKSYMSSFNGYVTSSRGVEFITVAIEHDRLVDQASAWGTGAKGLATANHLLITCPNWLISNCHSVARREAAFRDVYEERLKKPVQNPSGPLSAEEGGEISTPAATVNVTPREFSISGEPLLAASQTLIVDLPVTRAARFGVSLYLPPGVNFQLRSPAGVVVQSVSMSQPEEWFGDLSVQNPAIGTWKAELINTTGAQAQVFYGVWFEGAALTLRLSMTEIPDLDTLQIVATLRDGANPITGATVTASLVGLSKTFGPLTLLDNGQHGDGGANDGVYGIRVGPLLGDDYRVRVQAAGPGFVRTVLATVAAAPNDTPRRNLFTTATPTLAWNRVSWATAYEVEIDDDPQFGSPFTPLNTSELFVVTPALADGVYFWRVKAVGAGGAGPWSMVERFTISAP